MLPRERLVDENDAGRLVGVVAVPEIATAANGHAHGRKISRGDGAHLDRRPLVERAASYVKITSQPQFCSGTIWMKPAASHPAAAQTALNG